MPIVVKFHLKCDQTPGFQNYKFGSGQESKIATITKKSKNIKSTFSPEPFDIIGYKFAWNISGTLVFKIVKIKKKSTPELGHSDLLSVYKSNFCSNANISRKHECILFRFDHNGP